MTEQEKQGAEREAVGLYRKKPVVIEAEQFTQERLERHLFDGAPLPAGLRVVSSHIHKKDRKVWGFTAGVETLEGFMRAEVDDWIIKGVQGEFYPCKPDIFAATYDAAPASQPVGEAVAGPLSDEQRARYTAMFDNMLRTAEALRRVIDGVAATAYANGRRDATPSVAQAGLSNDEIDRIWDETLRTERNAHRKFAQGIERALLARAGQPAQEGNHG